MMARRWCSIASTHALSQQIPVCQCHAVAPAALGYIERSIGSFGELWYIGVIGKARNATANCHGKRFSIGLLADHCCKIQPERPIANPL